MKKKKIMSRSGKKNVNIFRYKYVLAVIVFIGFGFIVYFQQQSKFSAIPPLNSVEIANNSSTNSSRPTPTVDPIYALNSQSMIYNTSPDPQSSVDSNYKQYQNSQADFTIDYPNFLTRTEYYPLHKEGVGIPPAKMIFFCEKPLDISKLDFTQSGKGFCEGGGIEIQYDGNGWGGGCDSENRDTIVMMGKAAGYCSYPTSFSQLYYGPPRGEENNTKYNPHSFSLTGVYGDRLSKSEVEKMIATFKVIDP